MALARGTQRHPSQKAVEEHIVLLREEMNAAHDRRTRASIHAYIAFLLESLSGNVSQAVSEYLAAYNTDPTFRFPIFALIRLFERRQSVKNLIRLYEAELESTTHGEQRAKALTDMGLVFEDHLGRHGEAASCYKRALATSRSPTAAFMLERVMFASGDVVHAHEAILLRAARTTDTELKRCLLLEFARFKADEGEREEAFRLVRRTLEQEGDKLRSYAELERLSREHDCPEDQLEALEGIGTLVEQRPLRSASASVITATSAAPFWREAAWIRARSGDDAGAIVSYDRALASLPDSSLLRLERFLANARLGDTHAAANDALHLLHNAAALAPWQAPLWLSAAESAGDHGDTMELLRNLNQAVAADPESAFVHAVLDDGFGKNGYWREKMHLLVRWSEFLSDRSKQRVLWQAAHIGSDVLEDLDASLELFERALASSKGDALALVHAALQVAKGAQDQTRERLFAKTLLTSNAGGEDKAYAARELYMSMAFGDPEARALLAHCLPDQVHAAWAPYLAWIDGAMSGDALLVAQAHERIAILVEEPGLRVAHRLARARSLVRQGALEDAVDTLRHVLAAAPAHPYAVQLLEELLRRRGDTADIVALLQNAAAGQKDSERAAVRQMLAGFAAEEVGDAGQVVASYEKAAATPGVSDTALWFLYRFGLRTGAVATVKEALRRLAANELQRGAGGRFSVEFAELVRTVDGSDEAAAESYATALSSSLWSRSAAASIAFLQPSDVSPSVRAQAFALLASSAQGAARTDLLREAFRERVNDDAAHLPKEMTDTLDASFPFWTSFICFAQDIGSVERSAAWRGICKAIDQTGERAETELVQRWYALSENGAPAQQGDEASHSRHLSDSLQFDELSWSTPTAEARFRALEALAEHIPLEEQSTSTAAERGRAALLSGHFEQAADLLHRVVERDASDLSSWESLRVAAHATGRWTTVVECCDLLASHCEGELCALLLEEAAATLMDQLKQPEEAEKRFEKAFELDPESNIAYYRLRDLWTQRAEVDKLLHLTTKRAEVIDESEELTHLLYTLARLQRALDAHDEALAAIEQLLIIEPLHAGGLALEAEIHVAKRNWQRAVGSLQRLTTAAVPQAQKRVAHLGAADFLENKLYKFTEAIDELERIVALGLEDAALYERIAKIAERSRQHDRAAKAWEEAAARSQIADVAKLERRAAAVHVYSRKDTLSGIQAYRRALRAEPTDLRSGQALMELLDDAKAREAFCVEFEAAVRSELTQSPVHTDSLKKLLHVAQWSQQSDLEVAINEVITAVGLELSDSGLSSTPQRRPIYTLRESLSEGLTRRLLPVSEVELLVLRALAEVLDSVDKAAAAPLARANRVKSHSVKDEALLICNIFGVQGPEVYYANDLSTHITPYRHKGRLNLIIPRDLEAPLSHQNRFSAAYAAAAESFGLLPLLQRSPRKLSLMLEALRILTSSGAQAPTTDEASRQVDHLQKHLSRKLRSSFPKLMENIEAPGPATFGELAQKAHAGPLAAGALVAGDVSCALKHLLEGEVNEQSVTTSRLSLRLCGFWYSTLATQIRQRLGNDA